MFSMVGWKVMFHDKEYDCIVMKFVSNSNDKTIITFPISLSLCKPVILAINSDGVMETLKAENIEDFKFFK